MNNEHGSKQLRSAVYQEERRLGVMGEELESYWLAMFSYLLGGLEGKRILDIGCGGDYNRGKWPPRFPRLAKSYGVDVVGIDTRINPEKEDFEAYLCSVQDLPDMFPSESFDGVLVANFWNQPSFTNPDLIFDAKHLQHKTYQEIFRILKSRSVSINHANQSQRDSMLPPLQDELLAMGYEIIYYHSGEDYANDLVVLRKP